MNHGSFCVPNKTDDGAKTHPRKINPWFVSGDFETIGQLSRMSK
jgi:hypothetical protein